MFLEVSMKTIRITLYFSVILVFIAINLTGCVLANNLVAEAFDPSPIPTSVPVEPISIEEPTAIPTTVPTAVQTVPLEPTPPEHVLIPVEFEGKEQVIHDQVTEPYASQNRAAGGDEFKKGRFERPFDQNMVYLGNLDIVKSTMIRTDPNFIFVTIEVAKPIASAIYDTNYYGLELDLNRDGRSLYMIRGLGPLTETWTTDGMDAWKSTAAEQPSDMAAEGGIPVTGALGFDINLLKSGRGTDNDLAWIRLKPGTDNTVEIAFKNSIVGGEKGSFIWRPFTDGAPFSELEYDLQVNYTLEQAGSPYKGEFYYPLKDVFAVDNTCRVASGFEADGNEPGICPLPAPPQSEEKDRGPCVGRNCR